jgi:hypothetical protein
VTIPPEYEGRTVQDAAGRETVVRTGPGMRTYTQDVVATGPPPEADPVPPLWSQWWFWVSLAAPVLLLVAAVALVQRDDETVEAVAGPTTSVPVTVSTPPSDTLPVPAPTTAPPPVTSPAGPAATAPPAPTLPVATPAPTLAPTPAPTAAPPPSPSPTSAPTAPTVAPPATSFGDGQHAVGTAVAPGRYTAPGGETCEWQRRAAEGEELLGTFQGLGPTVVDLTAPETFLVGGCGTFGPAPTTPDLRDAVEDGTWIVGTQVAAGRWQTAGGATCTWATLNAFTGDPEDVRQEAPAATNPTVVELRADDVGFLVQGGCRWSPVR